MLKNARVTARASAPRSAGSSAAGGCNDVVCRQKLRFTGLGRHFLYTTLTKFKN